MNECVLWVCGEGRGVEEVLPELLAVSLSEKDEIR